MKTLLSFFGMIFFALLTIFGVALVLYYFDLTDAPGILNRLMQTNLAQAGINLPSSLSSNLRSDLSGELSTLIPQATVGVPNLGSESQNPADSLVQITVVGSGQIDKFNPLASKPLPIVPTLPPADPPTSTPMPTPRPTATPVPPMDPVEYQTEAMIRLKRFASVSESWLGTNDKLMQNNSLLQDPAWRSEVKANLSDLAAAGQALANIGRPPAEYEQIDAWFKRVGPESVRLQANYLRALDSANPQDFTAAGDNFTRIKQYLTQAAQLMLVDGWKVDQ